MGNDTIKEIIQIIVRPYRTEVVIQGGIWRTMHRRLCINCYGTG
jgi:hypothetical protein